MTLYTDPVQAILERPSIAQRFRNIRLLGKGAAGSVYYAQDVQRGGGPVALKILSDKQAFDRHTRERFRREMEILSSLAHPNLVTAYDIIEVDDHLAFSMEYLDGSDLSCFLKRSPAPHEDEIRFVFCGILLGLHELHQQKVIHRDIKLENIFLDSLGNPKIGDLGLVKMLASEGLTSTGILLGTAQYLPPEYIKQGVFDARGDIYAVGTMLLEVLTRKRRLAELRGIQAVEKLIEQGFRVDEAELEGLSYQLKQILRKSLEPDLMQRYQNALEMRSDLLMTEEHFREQEKSRVARPKSRAKPLGSYMRYLWGILIGIVLAILSVFLLRLGLEIP